jgi:hypothetical protein
MKVEYHHFPPKNFTPRELRNMQERTRMYISWLDFYKSRPDIKSYDYVIKFWYFLDGRVEVGEFGFSTKFEDTTLEMMEAIEKTNTFCTWLPPHYLVKSYEEY